MTKIFAHRGASKYAPENTLPAFELAYQMKAQGIETDVQLTKDNVPILIHDESLDRTTNGSGFVKDYTFNELKELDAGSWFSKEYSNTPLISLREFLTWIKNKPLFLNIELKNNKIDYEHLESIVFDMVKEFELLDRTTISTFNHKSVSRLKKYNHLLEIAFLTKKKKNNLITDARTMGANVIHIHYNLLNSALITECKFRKMKIRVFTVNECAAIKKCYNLGCEGLFTDVPDKALLYSKDKTIKLS